MMTRGLREEKALLKPEGDFELEEDKDKDKGDYHRSLKEYDKAIEKYERGLPKIRKFAVLSLEYSLLENFGNAYLEISRFEKSLICFRHSRSLGKKSADQYMEAKAVWNMSKTCQESGDTIEALNYGEMAGKICSGSIDVNLKKLDEVIKEWMVKRVGSEIKDSGLQASCYFAFTFFQLNVTSPLRILTWQPKRIPSSRSSGNK